MPEPAPGRFTGRGRASAWRGGAAWAWALAITVALGACGGGGPPDNGIPAGTTAGTGQGSTEPGLTGGVDTVPSASGVGSSRTPGATNDPATRGPATDEPVIIGDVDIERLATGETPPDWVEIHSNDDACRQAVPPDWVDSGLPGHVLSPEIHVTSIVANDAFAGWAEHVAHLQSTYFADGQEAVLDNDRLFLLRSTKRGGASHVLALRGDGASCGIELAIDEAGVARYAPIGVQILYTLAERP